MWIDCGFTQCGLTWQRVEVRAALVACAGHRIAHIRSTAIVVKRQVRAKHARSCYPDSFCDTVVSECSGSAQTLDGRAAHCSQMRQHLGFLFGPLVFGENTAVQEPLEPLKGFDAGNGVHVTLLLKLAKLYRRGCGRRT